VGDECGIYYRPDVAEAVISRARRAFLSRLISTAISLAVFGVLWAVWPDTFASWAPWFIGISLLTGGVTALLDAVRWIRAQADAGPVRAGLALGLNREGVLIGEQWLPWPEVGSMLVKPGSFGSSTRLVTTGRDQATLTVPLDLTDAMPATLDSVVRVLSGGRTSVDLSRLD
jgi:hypothetical protein